MNKKRKQSIFLVLILQLSQILAIPSAAIAENISPIQSIDWAEELSDELKDESQEESSLEESLSDSVDDTNVSSDEELIEESSESTTTAESELNTSDARQFLESLSQRDRRTVEFVNFMSAGENVEMISQNTLIDDNKYYTAQLIPPFLPQTIFLKVDEDGNRQAHLSLDDLIKYTVDALNSQPQIYEGTVVEELYTFAQNNYEDIEGKVVEIDPTTNSLTDSIIEITRIEAYLTEVTLEWLGQEGVLDAFESNELGEQILINGDLAVSFNEIAQSKQADYPELADFFEEFVNVEGTMNVDYTNGVFGFGLVIPSEGEDLKGLEMYIAQSQGMIIDFEEDIIYAYEEFSDFVGSDVIQQIQELEESLVAEDFVEATE